MYLNSSTLVRKRRVGLSRRVNNVLTKFFDDTKAIRTIEETCCLYLPWVVGHAQRIDLNEEASWLVSNYGYIMPSASAAREIEWRGGGE